MKETEEIDQKQDNLYIISGLTCYLIFDKPDTTNIHISISIRSSTNMTWKGFMYHNYKTIILEFIYVVKGEK